MSTVRETIDWLKSLKWSDGFDRTHSHSSGVYQEHTGSHSSEVYQEHTLLLTDYLTEAMLYNLAEAIIVRERMEDGAEPITSEEMVKRLKEGGAEEAK